MATPRPSRVSWVLLVAVVAAFAVGAAASILVRAVTAPASSGPVSLVYLPPWLLTLGSFGLLAFFGISLVVMHLNAGTNVGQSQFAVRVLMAVLVAVVFLLALHYLGGGGSGGGNTTAQNASGTPPATGGNNVTHYVGGSGGVVTWPGLPPWLPFVVLAAVVLVVIIIVAPEVRRYAEERRGGKATTTPAEVARVREALTRAETDLREGHDPRDVILALYAAMLARLQPMTVGLDVSTPEEIRAVHLERLGVRPAPARTLTRLFEEARYSPHPMGPESSRGAEEAVRAVLDDLDRREPPS